MGHRRHLGIGAAVVAAIALAATVGSAPSTPTEALAPDASRADQARSEGLSVGALDAVSTTIDRISRAGVLTPKSGVAVANLTIRPGQYLVEFSYDVRFDSAFQPGELRCGIVDNNNNGVRSFLAADPDPLYSGAGWQRRSHRATFSLPDLTLGIRCFPAGVGFARASFRDVTLSATGLAD